VRVFISSTVYDLIDVRAELTECLREMGIAPVLSDDKLSDFRVQHDVNSIETCLVNVASCDEMILVLNQRYGPKLGAAGYEDISATHLEYRHAVKSGIPVRVFVRDRLDADYVIWKKNKHATAMELAWVSSKDHGLLELMEEHKKLHAKPASSNWYFPFTSPVDLKAAIKNHFEDRILPQRLVEAIQSNSFPVFDVDLDVTQETLGSLPGLKFKAVLTNIGGGPAFNCRIHWADDEPGAKRQIFSPGQSTSMCFVYALGRKHVGTEKALIVEYDSAIGVSVRDTFQIAGHVHGTTMFSGGTLKEREFRRCPPLEFKITD